MELKKISMIIKLTKRISKLNEDILKFFPESPCEYEQYFSGGYETMLYNHKSLTNRFDEEIEYLEKWRGFLVNDKPQKLNTEQLKEVTHLINLKVPKAEICRKFKISYPTLQKYLALETIEDSTK